MTVSFIRILFLLLAAVIGYQIGTFFTAVGPSSGLIGLGVGLAAAVVIIVMELAMAKISLRGLSAAVFGLILALIVSRFVTEAIDLIHMNPVHAASVKLVIVIVLAYMGMVFALRGREEFSLIIPYIKLQPQKRSSEAILLDSNVIIDGRIVDVLHTRFIDGTLIVPKFVLKELHRLSDSADPVKRSRGKRGLDVLGRLSKDARVNFRIHEQELPEVPDVDAKLVKLALLLDAKILTNDTNLYKIAELQNVSILNLNELAKALRPVVLPGERIEVTLAREGKERDQAVAYLNDGTMVVVENARRMIGSTQKVAITSVLQTGSGRMIFARIENGR